MSSRTVIVIPLYKDTLSDTEHISIARCYELWAEKYDIVVVSPKGVDMSAIFSEFPLMQNTTVERQRMSSIAEYNKLLLSCDFYALFSAYEYMLIYQADCFVFNDDLERWLDGGYDYVGAPWYFALGFAAPLKRFAGSILYSLGIYHTNYFRWGKVGNGGLSLRKTQSFIDHFSRSPKLSKRAERGRLNEDIYWSLVAKEFKKPAAKLAAEFCGDMTPSICPENVMAAHGWNKNSVTIAYWKEKIEKSGTYFVE